MNNKIEVTENAQEYIKKILSSEKSNFFRITVLGGGCAGFQYKFDFTQKANEDDIIYEYNNAKVLIDKTSIEFIFFFEVVKKLTL